jgi:hypothetical protein
MSVAARAAKARSTKHRAFPRITEKAAFGRLFCIRATRNPADCKTLFPAVAAIRQNPAARAFTRISS